MKILIASVPGSGKTTILQLVKKKLPNVKTVAVGDLMFEVAREKFKIKNRDEMRKKLSVQEHRYAQKSAYEKIARMKNKIVLIDTHLSVKTPRGFFPGLSDELAKMIKLDGIILLEFNPKDIIGRRKKDAKLKKIESAEIGTIRIPREREIETEKEIEEHQQFNRQYAFIVGNVANAPVKILEFGFKEKKPFAHAKEAAEEIIKLIKK